MWTFVLCEPCSSYLAHQAPYEEALYHWISIVGFATVTSSGKWQVARDPFQLFVEYPMNLILSSASSGPWTVNNPINYCNVVLRLMRPCSVGSQHAGRGARGLILPGVSFPYKPLWCSRIIYCCRTQGKKVEVGLDGAGRINRYTCPRINNTELGNCLFLEFWHQIRLQKYKINSQ